MLRVRHDPSSAAEVRRVVAADLCEHGLTRDSVDDVVLVASELIGNAVTHVSDPDDLDVDWSLDSRRDGSFVLLRVHDSSTDTPHVKHAGATATNGRGLAIVAAVAAEWGVRTLQTGKQVWARVPVQHVL